MKKRVLCAGLLALALMVMGVQPAAAQTTRVVDDDGFATAADCNAFFATYSSIAAAEADSGSGDTIKVCPGVYTGVFINVDNLTVLGAQAGVDARTRATLPTDESIIDDACGPVQISADNVVLNGFTVQGSTMSDPCFIAGIWTNPGFGGNNGGYQILNNIVQNNIFGIFLNSNCTNATLVQFNLIQNNNNPGPGAGNGIESEFGLCNTDIDKNKFSGHINASVLIFTGGPNLDVTTNELVGGTNGARIVFGSVSNSTIVGNTSIGSTAINGTIRLFGGNSNITINSNTLFNGIRGIRVDNPFAIGANTGVVAHFNCIDGNTVAGMQVDSGGHSGTLNAENNWWGSPSGPTTPSNPGGTGDALIDPDGVVDFIPFLNQCPTQPTGNAQKDLVAGTGTIMSSGDVVHVNGSRNKNTSAVSGRFFVRYANGAEIGGRVTCLTVNLNKAGVGGVIERVKGTPPPGSNEVLITVLDMGEPGTLDEVSAVRLAAASTSCPSTGPTSPISKGNYVVKSDPPPELLSIFDTLIAEFETAADCSSSVVCSGTGELVEP
jgi:hypothetical protein